MTEKEKEQIEFVMKVVKRYKENGGYIYKEDGTPLFPKGKRVSLADFIIEEVGCLLVEPFVASHNVENKTDFQ